MRCLLFDYGGTLDADGTTWLERFHHLYKENGLDVPRSQFDRAFYDCDDRLSARHRLQGLDLEHTLRLQVKDVLETLGADRSDLVDPIAGRFAADSRRQFSRLRPTLERLRQRFCLGVVSNFYGNLEGILKAEGLLGLFTVVADSGVLGITKPDPRIFLHATKAVGVEPRDCVMVGDSVARDMAGATAVGMKKALITARPQAARGDNDWTLRSVADLEGVLP
ncbi:MAG: HAD family hydrolase [Elusimicrobiota bacterium]